MINILKKIIEILKSLFSKKKPVLTTPEKRKQEILNELASIQKEKQRLREIIGQDLTEDEILDLFGKKGDKE